MVHFSDKQLVATPSSGYVQMFSIPHMQRPARLECMYMVLGFRTTVEEAARVIHKIRLDTSWSDQNIFMFWSWRTLLGTNFAGCNSSLKVRLPNFWNHYFADWITSFWTSKFTFSTPKGLEICVKHILRLELEIKYQLDFTHKCSVLSWVRRLVEYFGKEFWE